MALHTYEFYKRRKNEPKWKDDYIRVRNLRIVSITMTIIVISVCALFYFYAISHNITFKNLNFDKVKGFGTYFFDNIRGATYSVIDYVKHFFK